MRYCIPIFLISTLISCSSPVGSHADSGKAGGAAQITFNLAVDEKANWAFKEKMYRWATSHQFRGFAVGLSGGAMGTPKYVVGISGSCDGAIEELVPVIKDAAAGLNITSEIVKKYRLTAKCKPFVEGD